MLIKFDVSEVSHSNDIVRTSIVLIVDHIAHRSSSHEIISYKHKQFFTTIMF